MVTYRYVAFNIYGIIFSLYYFAVGDNRLPVLTIQTKQQVVTALLDGLQVTWTLELVDQSNETSLYPSNRSQLRYPNPIRNQMVNTTLNPSSLVFTLRAMEFSSKANGSELRYIFDVEVPISSDTSMTMGTVEFPCECFPRPGRFEISASDLQASLRSNTLVVDVKWPKLQLKLNHSTESIYALHSSIGASLRLISNDPSLPTSICRTFDQKLSPVLRLLRQTTGYEDHNGPNATRDALFAPVSEILLRIEQFLRIGPETGSGYGHQFRFHCSALDTAGLYKMTVAVPRTFETGTGFKYETKDSNSDPDLVLVESEPFRVRWASGEYQLRLQSESVFPCTGRGLLVTYKKPSCDGATNVDRIRLYATTADRNPVKLVNSVNKQVYIGERRLSDQSAMTFFGCEHFDLVHPAYCFMYVSVAGSGAVTRHVMQCIRTEKKALPTNGEWTAWESWSLCVGSCESSFQHRRRRCNAPMPKNGGKFCEGLGIETRSCELDPCPANDTISAEAIHLVTPLPLEDIQPCECGCNISSADGEFGLLAISQRCAAGSAVWQINAAATVDARRFIKFRFLSYAVSAATSDERLRIREAKNGALIFDSRTVAKRVVLSWPDSVDTLSWILVEGDAMRVEHWRATKEPSQVAKEPEPVGQEYDFEPTEPDATVLQWQFISEAEYYSLSGQSKPLSRTLVVLMYVGVSTVGVIICSCLMVALCICFTRYTKRKMKAKCSLLKANVDDAMNTSSVYGNSVFDPIKCSNRLSAEVEDYDSKLKYNRISQASTDSSSCGGTLGRGRAKLTVGQQQTVVEVAVERQIRSPPPKLGHEIRTAPKPGNDNRSLTSLKGSDKQQQPLTSGGRLTTNAKPASNLMPGSKIRSPTKSGNENRSPPKLEHENRSTSLEACDRQKPLISSASASKVSNDCSNGSSRHRRRKVLLGEIPELDDDNDSIVSSSVERQATSDETQPLQNRPKPVSKRSVGIQLNSPALTTFGKPPLIGLNYQNSAQSTAQNTPHSCSSPNHMTTVSLSCDSPSPSWAGTEQDFEYDYYEPTVPGSFLNPGAFLNPGTFLNSGSATGAIPESWWSNQSDLNIDDILADSELLKTPTQSEPLHPLLAELEHVDSNSNICDS